MNSKWLPIKIERNKFSSFVYTYGLIFAQGILHWLFPRQTTYHRDSTFAKLLWDTTGYLKGINFCENNFLQNLLLRMRCPNNISEFVIANEQLVRILKIRFLEYWVAFDRVIELFRSYRNHFSLKFWLYKSVHSFCLNVKNFLTFPEILLNSFLRVVILQYFCESSQAIKLCRFVSWVRSKFLKINSAEINSHTN